MSNLSPNLRELVMASRSATLPTAADSARVFEALRVRLGDGALLGASAAQGTAVSMSTGFLFGKGSMIAVAGLAILGGLWFFAARDTRTASRDTNAVVNVAVSASGSVAQAPAQTSPSGLSAPVSEPSARLAAAEPAAEHEDAPPANKRRVRDRLAEEVALLSRAESALHSGSPMAALDALNEHERRFGNGLLAEERIAARVQALCALGRSAEADAQLARLSRNSLHGQSSRQACGPHKSN